MLQPGDPIPDVSVWISTQERVSVRDLARDRPLLLLFYLFDWSST